MKNLSRSVLTTVCAITLLSTGCDRLSNYPVGNPVPSAQPTLAPTTTPSSEPTSEPTAVPTALPTADPTAFPTALPTAEPTAVPTSTPSASASPSGPRTVYALTSSNTLLRFNSNAPTTIVSTIGLSGLPASEDLVAIDFRPANQMLYALSNTSKLYSINTTSGLVTQVGTAAFTPVLSGAHFGFDFNPTVDRIRLHSDLRQDLRLHPDTGAVAAVDTELSYTEGDVNVTAAPAVAGTAYTNSVAGATSTELFAIDADRDVLVRLANPNDGKLSTVGPLNVSTTSEVGFDIATDGAAYATLKSGVASNFYIIDLNNGGATFVGAVGTGDQTILGIAVE